MAAKELFLRRGFNKTSVASIADSVGIANAAVYWYFPTKDHILAEVFIRALDEEMIRLKDGPPDPLTRLHRGLVDLRPYRQLHMALHERMGESEVVERAHDRLIEWIRDTVSEGLAYHGRDPVEESDVVELVVVLFEGANVPGVRSRTATEVIDSLFDKLGLQPTSPATSQP